MKRTHTTRLVATLVTGSALLLFGAGCFGQKKVNECNSLIGVINNGIQGIEKAPKLDGDPNTLADLKVMADAMDKVSQDAAKVELSLPELKKFSGEYQSMANAVAKATRELATAADAKDRPKIESAQAAVEKAVKVEDPLVEGINKFCQAP